MSTFDKVDIVGEYLRPDIIEESQLNIEQFDLSYLYGDNKLIGHMKKDFVRVSTRAIKNLINQLQLNPNCSYLTCANDVIKEGVVPDKISVMLKRGKGNFQRHQINGTGHSLEFRESIASKLLNWLECPTAYNFAVRNGGEIYVASVDFISKDEKFYSLEDFEMGWSYNLDKMTKKLNEIMDQFEFKSEEEKLKNKIGVFNDFKYSLLLREGLLADGDFHTGNMGLLYNEKEKTFRFVNFDMEFLFLSPNMFFPLKCCIEKIRNNDPEIYEKFINKTKQIYDSFDKERTREITDYNTFGMYHTLIDRAKAILRFDKNLRNRDKIKNFFGMKKQPGVDNVK